MLGEKPPEDQKAKTEAAKDWKRSHQSFQNNRTNVGTEIKADRCSYGEGEGGAHTGEANQVVKRGGKPDRMCRDTQMGCNKITQEMTKHNMHAI